ncbi:hypothetical protein OPQ81_011974 [Rhizoctonia solani]|nr:hypothetical protein OPQ81_011974 [Rhizoctonia solani]
MNVVSANYNNDDATDAKSGDLGSMILAVCWAMTAVAALFLGARLFTKVTTHKRLWWDDWLLVASFLMLVAFSSTTTYGVQAGIGKHHATTGKDSETDELQLIVVIATIFSVLGASWSKTSFALTLLRITGGTIHYIIWVIIVSMNVVLTFNAILQFLWCQPASVAWHSGRGGTCWSQNVIVYYSITAAAYSAGMDILLAMVPWAVIMRLSMHMREKTGRGHLHEPWSDVSMNL